MNHRVIIEQLYAEDIFDLFYKLIIRDGGDGAGAIVCGNPKEAMDLFVKYIQVERPKFIKGLTLDYYETNGFKIFNWHDNNENFIFTNNPNFELLHGDITWVINNDCSAGFSDINKEEIWLEGIN